MYIYINILLGVPTIGGGSARPRGGIGGSQRPGALLEIFNFFFHTVAVCLNNNGTLLYVTGEDDIARFDSHQYN
jgi:hypothetical protein